MISVVITTYKREPELLCRAIDSVLTQTYRDFELIIVDDSPNDYALRNKVKQTVQKYQNENDDINITYIEHNTNQGACVARNTGMENAKGEFIAYLDDDDEWLPNKLEKQINVIQSSDAALVYCGFICKNDIIGSFENRETEYHRGYVFDQLIFSNFIDSTSIPLIRKKCLQEIGGFDIKMQSAQDYDVWLRIAQKNKIDYVHEPLVIYHEHDGEQITSNPIKKIKGLERLNTKYKDYIENNKAVWYQRNICITPYYAKAGNKHKALQVWLRCACKCPLKIINNMRFLRLIIKG